MKNKSYDHIIVGGGLAATNAAQGIRERDKNASVLIIGAERYLPYHRPPLSKKLWIGNKQVESIFIKDEAFYRENGIDILLGIEVAAIDAAAKTVTAEDGNTWQYGKLLLATGGVPRKLNIPGGDLEGVSNYRYLDDYLVAKAEAVAGRSVVVIGGGFIGSEIAAALNLNDIKVTLVFPEQHLVQRVFPEDLARAISSDYVRRGVELAAGDVAASIELQNGKYKTRTRKGKTHESEVVIVGAGIVPSVELASSAGLKVSNGIEVNQYLQTSNPDIFAAGDNTLFPYTALGGEMRRVEHWDNAVNQGRYAGHNMVERDQAYDYMPYFFSDLFDFGYEAVGDVDSRLETFADWQTEFEKGVIYYLKDNVVRGAMMCGVWDKVLEASELIRSGRKVTQDDLRGAIK